MPYFGRCYCLTSGRCYCHGISGRYYNHQADVMPVCWLMLFASLFIFIFMWQMLLPYLFVADLVAIDVS